MGQCAPIQRRNDYYRGTSYDGKSSSVQPVGFNDLKRTSPPNKANKSRKRNSKDKQPMTNKDESKISNGRPSKASDLDGKGADHENEPLTLDMRHKSSLQSSSLSRRPPLREDNVVASVRQPSRIGLEAREGSVIRRPNIIIGEQNNQEQTKPSYIHRSVSERLKPQLPQQLQTIMSEGSSKMRESDRSSNMPIVGVVKSREPQRRFEYSTSQVVQDMPIGRSVVYPSPNIMTSQQMMPLNGPPHINRTVIPIEHQPSTNNSQISGSLPMHISIGQNPILNQIEMHVMTSQHTPGFPPMTSSQDGGVFVAQSMPISSHVSMTADIVHSLRLDCGEDIETKELRRFDYDRRIQL